MRATWTENGIVTAVVCSNGFSHAILDNNTQNVQRPTTNVYVIIIRGNSSDCHSWWFGRHLWSQNAIYITQFCPGDEPNMEIVYPNETWIYAYFFSSSAHSILLFIIMYFCLSLSTSWSSPFIIIIHARRRRRNCFFFAFTMFILFFCFRSANPFSLRRFVYLLLLLLVACSHWHWPCVSNIVMSVVCVFMHGKNVKETKTKHCGDDVHFSVLASFGSIEYAMKCNVRSSLHSKCIRCMRTQRRTVYILNEAVYLIRCKNVFREWQVFALFFTIRQQQQQRSYGHKMNANMEAFKHTL